MLEKIYDKYDFDQDYEVYKYGQQVLIFNSIVNIFMFILGLCLHEGFMTLVWMLAFSGLRVNLGGYHCDSPVKCFVSSNLIFFKYIPFINKKAKIAICIELICLLIPKINMIVILALCENIILYLMTAKEKVNS